MVLVVPLVNGAIPLWKSLDFPDNFVNVKKLVPFAEKAIIYMFELDIMGLKRELCWKDN